MPCTLPVVGGGSPDKAAALARLLPSCLAGAALLCLLLLASRRTVVDSGLDVHVTVRGGAHEAKVAGSNAALPAAKPYRAKPPGLVLAATHHKTGTVQFMCLAGVLRNAAKATVTAQIGGVTAADVAAAAAAAAAQQQGSGKRGSAPPGVLLTAMPLAQRCYGQAGGESFRCPIEDAPCTPDGAPLLSLDGCFVSLPLAELGVWHMVRRPLDIVVSALWFHQQEPAPEAWIDAEFGTRIGMMKKGGVPMAALEALGIGKRHEAVPYGQLLRTLPEETALLVEFWRSLPGLYAMARQFLALQRHPAALQLRYEDAAHDFNSTFSPVFKQFYPRRANTIMRGAQQCDPNTWTTRQTQGSNHVTAGKHPPGARERLQDLLLVQPEVRRHLCLLTEVLGYEEPRCGAVAARRLLL
ncbi:hypothetical protein ABPG77_010145 [Micractinium sp. CCAP 211/92]